MKTIRFVFIFCMLFSCFILSVYSQNRETENSIIYNVEAVGSAATGTYSPFWITSNRYGVLPIESGNGYLRPSIHLHQSFGKGFFWITGIDAVLSAPRDKNIFLQQLYAGIGYKNLHFTIGSKEQYTSLWDKQLSSGDMIQSANSRPKPEVHISIPDFLTVPYTKGWFHFRGYLSVGRSFDSDYLEDYITSGQYYTKNILWHDKSLFIRLKDTRNNFPVYLSFGVRHTAQWGGTSTNPQLGKQPQSFKDFIRIFFAKAGGEGASISDTINVLGAHHVAYDFQVGFVKENWELQAYHQHIAADKSGLLFYNKTDGLWGIQLDIHTFPWIKKVVMEYITTRNQSGPFHYLNFDHDVHPGRGGGADNYYNNGEYTTGHSYFNRSIGTPLILSPEYNNDGSIGFKSTRIQDWHLGFEGDLSKQLSYRTLITVMNGWGVHYAPFLKKKHGTSFLLEMKYAHPRLPDWSFTGSIAGDTGDITGDKSYGFCLGISKRGLLKSWL